MWPSSTLNERAYYKAKHEGSWGQATELKVMCDGKKLHKIVFHDHGPIQLCNHNLRAERALKELGQEYDPVCVQVLKAYKQYGFRYAYPQYSRRIAQTVINREYLEAVHREAKQRVDADGFDIKHSYRLVSMVRAKADDLETKIQIKLNDKERMYGNGGNPDRWCSDINKIKLTTQGIRAPSVARPITIPNKAKLLPTIDLSGITERLARL